MALCVISRITWLRPTLSLSLRWRKFSPFQNSIIYLVLSHAVVIVDFKLSFLWNKCLLLALIAYPLVGGPSRRPLLHFLFIQWPGWLNSLNLGLLSSWQREKKRHNITFAHVPLTKSSHKHDISWWSGHI